MSENEELKYYREMLDSEDLEQALMGVQVLAQIPDREARKILIEKVNHPLWQVRNAIVEALIEVIGKEDVPLLVEKIRSQDARERNAARSILKERGDIVIPFLVKNLESDDVDVRILSLNTLGMVRAREAIDSIVKMLDDPDQNVRESAIEALGLLKAELEVEILTERMLKEEDEWSKIPYIVTLGEIGDSYPVPYLIEYLDSEILQLPAIEALGKIKDERAFFPLLKLLKTEDKDIITQAVLARAEILSNIKERLKEENLEWVLEAIKEKTRERVAGQFIGKILSLVKNFTNEQLIKVFDSIIWVGAKVPLSSLLPYLEREEINESAERVLLENSVEDVDPWEILSSGKYGKFVVKSIIRYIGEKKKEKKKDWFFKCVKSSFDPIIKVFTIKEWGNWLEREDLKSLIDIIKDETDESVLREAIHLVSRYVELEEEIKTYANDENPTLREMAIKALGIMKSDFLDENYALFLGDASPNVRAMTLRSLGYYYKEKKDKLDEDKLSAIAALINDESDEVKDEVIISLGRIGTSEVVNYLLEFIDPEMDVNFSLLFYTLSELEDDRIKKKFKEILKENNNEQFIYLTVESIGKKPDAYYYEELKNLLNTDDSFLLTAVLEALSGIKVEEEAVLEKVKEILENSNDYNILSSSIRILGNSKYFPAVESIKKLTENQKEDYPDFLLTSILEALKNMNVFCTNLIYYMFSRKKFIPELFEYLEGISESHKNEVIKIYENLRSYGEKRAFLIVYRRIKDKESINHLKLALKEKAVSVRGTAYLHLYSIFKETGDDSIKMIEKLEREKIDPFLLNFEFDWSKK